MLVFHLPVLKSNDCKARDVSKYGKATSSWAFQNELLLIFFSNFNVLPEQQKFLLDSKIAMFVIFNP